MKEDLFDRPDYQSIDRVIDIHYAPSPSSISMGQLLDFLDSITTIRPMDGLELVKKKKKCGKVIEG